MHQILSDSLHTGILSTVGIPLNQSEIIEVVGEKGVKTVDKLSGISAAWGRFILSGKLEPASEVRPEILDSWRRCYAAGVDPYDGTSHALLNQEEIEFLQDKNRELIEVARPFMVKLSKFVAGSGFIVFLADERGFMMEVMGDDDFQDNARTVNLASGYGWREEEVGTNGIGTALALGRPFQVSGQEHYCQKIHSWTCSAAPILDEDGQVLGALQMSGPSYGAHLHTLGMVVAAVEAISDQMRINKQNRELTVLNNSLNNIFQTMSDGAVLINMDGIISQINPVAAQMLGKEVLGNSIQGVFGQSKKIGPMLSTTRPFSDVEVMVDSARGRLHCLVTSKPIKDEDGQVTGAVVFFNPINKVKNLVNRLSGAEASFYFKDIIGGSQTLLHAVQIGLQAASSTSNVLIQGESGTGKELFAQAIHNQSPRRDGPFIALNCAAIPRELIASELFGYSEGAFTGARRGGRPGKFELAAGGTLFLDEIGDMPLDQQASLLRVLQEKKITRIGGEKIIPVDVRVICASNKNLQEEIKKSNFRQDLYYRLNVIEISVPPLRQRREDIGLLFNHLLSKISSKMDVEIQYIEPSVLERLQNYAWPGNVRELENVVEKMLTRSRGPGIKLEHLPEEIVSFHPLANRYHVAASRELGSNQGHRSDSEAPPDLERQALLDLLGRHQGNISRVAQELGVCRNTVYRKMRFYQIGREFNFD
ncbi:MAG TPA: sigma-54-dependent Fis family transcriptional regulator [Syntrophomonadaceae bacterium]|nr:sigma-54-dependent Fis family transcriptional regulator [Syntrophomonadaceae bacterium]